MSNGNRGVSLRAAYVVVLAGMFLGAVGGVALAARSKGLSNRGLIAVAAAATVVVVVFAVGRMLRWRGVATPARVALQTGLAIAVGSFVAWLMR